MKSVKAVILERIVKYQRENEGAMPNRGRMNKTLWAAFSSEFQKCPCASCAASSFPIVDGHETITYLGIPFSPDPDLAAYDVVLWDTRRADMTTTYPISLDELVIG